jgi:photosystem II stability/assembly factor-like uncharacterized protein
VGHGGIILHTQNGGRDWEPQNSGTDKDLTSIAFVTPQSGWVLGTDATILHTEDGGHNERELRYGWCCA